MVHVCVIDTSFIYSSCWHEPDYLSRGMRRNLLRLEPIIGLEPYGAPRLVDMRLRGRRKTRDIRQLRVVDELAVGLVKEVVDAKRERDVRVGAVGETQ